MKRAANRRLCPELVPQAHACKGCVTCNVHVHLRKQTRKKGVGAQGFRALCGLS